MNEIPIDYQTDAMEFGMYGKASLPHSINVCRNALIFRIPNLKCFYLVKKLIYFQIELCERNVLAH